MSKKEAQDFLREGQVSMELGPTPINKRLFNEELIDRLVTILSGSSALTNRITRMASEISERLGIEPPFRKSDKHQIITDVLHDHLINGFEPSRMEEQVREILEEISQRVGLESQAQEGTIDQVRQEQEVQLLLEKIIEEMVNRGLARDSAENIVKSSQGRDIAKRMHDNGASVDEIIDEMLRNAPPRIKNQLESRSREGTVAKQTVEKYLHGELSLQEALEQEQEDTLDWARRNWEKISELFTERVEALIPNLIHEPEHGPVYSKLSGESISVGLVNEGQPSNAREVARLELDRNHMKGSLELSLERNKGEGQTSTVAEKQISFDRRQPPEKFDELVGKFDMLNNSINEFIVNIVRPELR